MVAASDGSAWATTVSGHLYHAIPGYAGLPFPYFFDTNNNGLYSDVPALVFEDSQKGIISGGYYNMLYTNNGGLSFNYGNVLDADGGYGYFNYPDGGATPNGAPQVYWQALSVPSPGVIFAAGTGGSILVSTDSGVTWHFVPGAADFPQDVDFFGIQMLDALNGYACGSNGQVFQTSDGFAHFTSQVIAAGKLRAIHMRDTAFGIVVGDFGQILRTQNGSSWFSSQVPNTAFGDLYGLSVVSPVLAYAVGKGGLVLVSFDDGQTWNQAASPTLHDLSQVFFTSPNDGYLTTSEGEILVTRDGTLTWEQQFSFGSVGFLSLDFPDATHGFAGGTLGTMLGTVTAGQPTCQINADCVVDAGAVSYLCDLDAGGICTACNTNQTCGPACSPCPVSTPFCWGGFCGECHTASDCTVNGPGTWSCRFGTCLNLNPPDAGSPDAGITDAGPPDAGVDAGPQPVDAGGDAGPVDAGCQAPDGAPMSCELPQSSGCGCTPGPGKPDAGLLLLFSLTALFFLPLRTARR
jgi:MYXO-CTERM domain-containing protein